MQANFSRLYQGNILGVGFTLLFCNSVYTEGDCDLQKVLGNLRKDIINFLMMTVIQ